MNLEELRLHCAIKQKKGLHFILASVIIWCAVLIVHCSLNKCIAFVLYHDLKILFLFLSTKINCTINKIKATIHKTNILFPQISLYFDEISESMP